MFSNSAARHVPRRRGSTFGSSARVDLTVVPPHVSNISKYQAHAHAHAHAQAQAQAQAQAHAHAHVPTNRRRTASPPSSAPSWTALGSFVGSGVFSLVTRMRYSAKGALRLLLLAGIAALLLYSLGRIRDSSYLPRHFSVLQKGHGRPGYPFQDGSFESDSEQRAAAVIDAFRRAWHAYASRCFGYDELLPVSGRCGNSRNGWGASIIDALSTAIIMGQKDIVQDIVTYIPRINFHKTGGWWLLPKSVNLFETTIRYMGGLLSGYDLLSSGLKENLEVDDKHVNALLHQAKVLANGLKFAFNTPSGVPFNRLWYEVGWHDPNQETNSLAAVGSLVLEWQRLSDLTGETHFAELAHRAEEYVLDPKPDDMGLQPGLLGTRIEIATGRFTDSWGSWGAGRDSAYEYMLKMFSYDRERFGRFAERWRVAARSTMRHMRSHPVARGRRNLTFLADWGGRSVFATSDHLAAFAAGNFILGGTVLDAPKLTKFGLTLVDSLHEVQTSTPSGLMPEKFFWGSLAVGSGDSSAEVHARTGALVRNPAYRTRPELLESYYHAYRATGDPKYREWSWSAFRSILSACATRSGALSGVEDVNSSDPPGGLKDDMQESFVFAELFKYAYLTFADGADGADGASPNADAPWQLRKDGRNDYVFNTEGHPLRAMRGRADGEG